MPYDFVSPPVVPSKLTYSCYYYLMSVVPPSLETGQVQMLERAVVYEGAGSRGGITLKPGDQVENVIAHSRGKNPLFVNINTVESPTSVAIVDFEEETASDGRAITYYGVGVSPVYLDRIVQWVSLSHRPGWTAVQNDQQDGSLATQAAAAARASIVTQNPAIANAIKAAGINRADVTAVHFSIPAYGPASRE